MSITTQILVDWMGGRGLHQENNTPHRIPLFVFTSDLFFNINSRFWLDNLKRCLACPVGIVVHGSASEHCHLSVNLKLTSLNFRFLSGYLKIDKVMTWWRGYLSSCHSYNAIENITSLVCYIYIYIYIYIYAHVYLHIYMCIYKSKKKDCNPTICRKIDNKVIQVEGEIYWEVDTIAFRFYWTIIRTIRVDTSDVKSTMDV